MGEKRTFKCCGSAICLFDGGASVEFRDGTVQNYANPREGIIAFENSVSGYIVKVLCSIIREYGYNEYTGEKKKKPRNESS